MSVYEDLTKEGYKPEEIRDAILESNSNVIGQLVGENYSNDEIFSAISQVSGLPSEAFNFDKPVSVASQTTDTTTTADKDMKDFKTYLKYKLKNNEIDQAEYDAQLSAKMKEGKKIESVGYARGESPAQQVSKAVASGNVLHNIGSPTAFVTNVSGNVLHNIGSPTAYTLDAIKNLATGSKDNDEKKEALGYLFKNDIIEAYNGNTNTVKLKDGRDIPFEASFLDSVYAMANTAFGEAFGGAAGATVGSAVPVVGTATGFKTGQAGGAYLGGMKDFELASKFLGVDYTTEDMIRAGSIASSDSMLFSAVATKLSNLGSNVISNKLSKIKTAFMNNDLNGAWETYKNTTLLTAEELDNILTQGSKLRGVDKPDLDTPEGKKLAFEMVALYDDTISGQVISAAKLNPKAISNAGRNLMQNTANIKSLVQTDDIAAIDEIAKLNKEANTLYGEMRKSFESTFNGVPLDFSSLRNKFQGTLQILEDNKSGFNDKLQSQISGFANRINGIETMDDLIQLNKDYNGLMNKVFKSGALNNSQYQSIYKGKNDIINELVGQVGNNKALNSDEKQMLLKSFTDANNAVSRVKEVINTDLYSALVSKKGNIKNQNKILDTIIAKAQEGSIKGELDDSTKLLNALDDDQYKQLEKNILGRIIENNAIDEKGRVVNFGNILPEIKKVEHLFTSAESKQIISSLDSFSSLVNNDRIMHFVSTLQPEIKLSSSGLSTDYTMLKPIEQASVARIFGRLQVVAPVVFRELGVDGLANKLPILKQWGEASKEKSLQLNLVDALAEAKDIPSFFNNILNTQGDRLSEPVRQSIKGLLTDYAQVNIALQNIPIKERLKIQEDFEKQQALRRKQVIKYATPAEEYNPNVLNAPKQQEIIDTEATRNYTKSSDGYYYDEFGNKYNSPEEIPSATTPLPTMIENKSSAKQPINTNIKSEAINPTAYRSEMEKAKQQKLNELNNASKEQRIANENKGQTTIDFSLKKEDVAKDIDALKADISMFTTKSKPTMIINNQEVNKTTFDTATTIASKINKNKGASNLTDTQRSFYKKNPDLVDSVLDMDWKPSIASENNIPTISDFMTKAELNKARSFASGVRSKEAESAYIKWKDSTKKVQEAIDEMEMNRLGF